VTVPSGPAVIETVDVALRSYFLRPASENQLTTPDEVQEAIMGLKFSRLRARTVYRTGHRRTFPSEQFLSSRVSSTQFFAPITFPKRGSKLE